MKKYKHLTSGPNRNAFSISVRESRAPKVDAALDFLLIKLRFTKSQITCDAILALAKDNGFVFEDQNESAKTV